MHLSELAIDPIMISDLSQISVTDLSHMQQPYMSQMLFKSIMLF